MQYNIDEIKVIRKRVGITQFELANASGVSQSLIAKIEAGKLDPSFSKAQKIFDALNELSKKDELKAKQIMNKKLIFVGPESRVKEVISLMRKHQISQLPVIKEQKAVGMISETILLDAVANKKIDKVNDIMSECPPIISKGTSLEIITGLLKFYPLVLVSEKGRFIGVITKSDIIRVI